METKYAAFLASRMTPELEPLRERIGDIGRESGRDVWIARKADRELQGKSYDETQIVCLEKVRRSERLICVLDGTYGNARTSWNPDEVSILELEIAMAMLAHKPIHIFLLEPPSKHYVEDGRLSSFLKVVRAVSPHSIAERPLPKEAVMGRIRQIIDKDQGILNKIKNAYGPLVQWLYEVRRRRCRRDVRFLEAEFAPVSSDGPEKTYIEALIRAADGATDMPTKLAKLWTCFRSLSAVPYTDPRFRTYLPLWRDMFSKWGSAAAWFDLHGHFLLGRLAAVNSLREVEGRLGSEEPLAPGETKKGVYGPIASEYYSMAKVVPSRRYRRLLLEEALSNLGKALTNSQGDISGLLSTRGSVLLELGEARAAVSDYERSLQIRISADEDLGRIGEAESYLGFGYFRLGFKSFNVRHFRRAQDLLEAGVQHLKGSDRMAFTVGAMKRLCIFYTSTLRLGHARTVFDEAYGLANEHGLYGQIRQLNTLKRLLRK